MSDAQTRIVELFAQLSLVERRDLMAHIRQIGLLEESFHSSITAEQHAQLSEGIEQANRGEVVEGNTAFDGLASRFNLKRL